MNEERCKFDAILPSKVVSDFMSLAERKGRSPSNQLEHLMRNACTAAARLDALKAIAAAELEAGDQSSERAPNAGELLDVSDGKTRSRSLERIGAANLKSTSRK